MSFPIYQRGKKKEIVTYLYDRYEVDYKESNNMVREYDISGENQDSSTQKPLTVNEPKRYHSSFAGPIVIIFILLLVGIGGYYIYTKGLPFKLPFNLPSNKISARALQNAFDSMGYTKMSMGDILNEESTGSLGAYAIIESEVDVRQFIGDGNYEISNIVAGIEGNNSDPYNNYSAATAYIRFKTNSSATTYVNDFSQISSRWNGTDTNIFETSDGSQGDISYHFIRFPVNYGDTLSQNVILGLFQRGTEVYFMKATDMSGSSTGEKALDSICNKLQIISPSTAFSMAAK